MTRHQLMVLIDRERERQGVSVRQLARRAGVSAYTLYHWRSRDYNPSVDSIISVLDSLGLELRLTRTRVIGRTGE